MRHFLTAALVICISFPVQAEDGDMGDFLKRFEELSKDAQTLMESWAEEMGPKLEELGPALEDLVQKMGDLSAYHAPEVLPNGDIIIRRKEPLESRPAPEAPELLEPGQTIDL